MADNIEHQDKGELVANCDQLQNDEVVVTTPVESRIIPNRSLEKVSCHFLMTAIRKIALYMLDS